MKGLIDVKPKVERIYQAMQYTGEKLNINGEHAIIYAFDYIAYDREWHEPYIGKMSEFTLKERYGIKEC